MPSCLDYAPAVSDSPPPELLDADLLVDRYGERIYGIAYRMTGNAADAEDVTQNVLIRVLEKAHTFRGESDPMGWIYRIAMNEAREVFRKQKRRPAVSLDSIPIDFGDDARMVGVNAVPHRPADPLVASEVAARVRDAIQELPDGYREAVVLMDLEGLPYKTAAELMGLTLAAFKTRLHRARLHLRNRLQAFWDSHDEGAGDRPDAARGGARS